MTGGARRSCVLLRGHAQMTCTLGGWMRGCPQKGRRKEQNQLNSVFDQGVRGQLCLGGAINSFRTLMALNVAFRIRIRE